ncbi:RNA polymerase sigma-70 factor [Larkinella punicea]|uniref:RNA polymerase sigma-70 factor n=1 Tax=Larkinella punicea TaxID=2315727 RepID=A0A368JI31_9BACT|nr:RNA polymerase sigma-70 factor [Larkinella punicea]RCR67202.1 RNA polymerase sigma-70 factor [Larkinella punicea]
MRIRKLPIRLGQDAEKEITLRLKAGDENAFEEIFYRYYKHLLAIGIKFLKNPDLAEDAVQDIFLKLWDHRDALNESYSIKNFLSVSMKNHVLNVIRNNHQSIWEYLSAEMEELNGEDTTSDAFQLQEYGTILEQGMQKLPPQREKVFRLRVFSGLDNEQVARQLSISVNTVKSQFTQATRFLKDYLSKHADLEGILPVLLFILFH